MSVFIFLSNCIIPVLVFYIVVNGLLKKVAVFDVFLNGAGEGVQIAWNLIPTMIGLFVGIGILRESGFLSWFADTISGALSHAGITDDILPSQLWPVILTRPFSASAATGLVLDLYESYGPDSFIGFAASLILSCSETLFYTMSVYFGSVKITKTGYTVVGGLVTAAVGVTVSIIMAHLLVN